MESKREGEEKLPKQRGLFEDLNLRKKDSGALPSKVLHSGGTPEDLKKPKEVNTSKEKKEGGRMEEEIWLCLKFITTGGRLRANKVQRSVS